MSREEQIERRLKELRNLGAGYSEAKSQVTYLEEFKKSKLAMLMKEFEKEGYSTSAAQEREARAHPEYIELLQGLKEAVQKAEYARWQLVTAQMGVEVWRSLESTRRAELHSTGLTSDMIER